MYQDILEIDYPIFDKLRAHSEFKIPKVLTQKEIFKLFKNVSTLANYTYFRTVYTCGLRLAEGLNLTIHDIYGERKLLKILGKGNKERYVPLPSATYQLLKIYWATHRNPTLIFPALGRGHSKGSISTKPMAMSTVQAALKRAAKKANMNPKGVRIHVLRHSYATHLLESGVSIKAVQKYLGHSSLKSTMIYLHLTNLHEQDSLSIINSVMDEHPLTMPFNSNGEFKDA